MYRDASKNGTSVPLAWRQPCRPRICMEVSCRAKTGSGHTRTAHGIVTTKPADRHTAKTIYTTLRDVTHSG